MKKLAIFSALAAVLLLAGCGAGLKKGVKIWCHGEVQLLVQLIPKDYPDRDDQAQEFMNAAGLHCLMDVENGDSTRENPSRACKCSGAAKKDVRVIECFKWAEETLARGGCYEY